MKIESNVCDLWDARKQASEHTLLRTYGWLLVDTFQALQKIKLNVMKCKQQETIYM